MAKNKPEDGLLNFKLKEIKVDIISILWLEISDWVSQTVPLTLHFSVLKEKNGELLSL